MATVVQEKPNRCLTCIPDENSMKAVCKIARELDLEKMVNFRSTEKQHCTCIVWKQVHEEIVDELAVRWEVEEVNIKERNFGEVNKKQREIVFKGLAKFDEFLVVLIDSEVINKIRKVALENLDRQTWRDNKFQPHITIGKFQPGSRNEEFEEIIRKGDETIEKKLKEIRGYFMVLNHAEIPYKNRQTRIWETTE